MKILKNSGRRLRRSMRAISPVIAVLLMIVIAVAASLVAYAWVMGYMGFTTSKVGRAIQIQSISYNDPDPTYMTVYVQNVGDSDLTISDIYVDGVQDNSAPLAHDLGKTETYGFVLEETWATQPAQITVKVVTTDGTFTELKKTFTSGGGNGGNGGTTQYTITVTQTANGAIAPPGTTSYDAGSTPSFTITPNGGYHIASITTDAGSQPISNPAGQTYTFPALAADGTLTATFAAAETTLLNDGFEATGGAWDDNWDQYGSTAWDQSSTQVHSGSYSARSRDGDEGDLTTDTLSTSGATSVTVSFWLYHTEISGSDLTLEFRSSNYGGYYASIADLGNFGNNNEWTLYTVTTTDSQFLHSNFRIRLDASLGSSEYVYIDDVVITKIP